MISLNQILPLAKNYLGNTISSVKQLPTELTNRIIFLVRSYFHREEVNINQKPESGALDALLLDAELGEYISLIKLSPPVPSNLSKAQTLDEYRQEFSIFNPLPAVIHLQQPMEEKKALKQLQRDVDYGHTSIMLDAKQIHNKEEAQESVKVIPEVKYDKFLSELQQGIAYYLSEYLKSTFENQGLGIFCCHTGQEYPLNITGDTRMLTLVAEKSCELFYVDKKGNKIPLFEKGDFENPGNLKTVSLKGKIEIDFSVQDIQAIVSVEKIIQ